MVVVPPEQHAELREFLQRIARGERIEHHETVRLRKDGSRVEVSVSLSPTKNAQGEVCGIFQLPHRTTTPAIKERGNMTRVAEG